MMDVGGQANPHIMTREEMKHIHHVWQEEFFATPEQQDLIARDRAEDEGKPKRQKKTQSRKHSRFNMHIRHTYGNKAVAFLIIRVGRFNADLLDGVAETLLANEGHQDNHTDQPPNPPYLRWMKEQARKRHRAGHAVWRKVCEHSDSWYQLSWNDRDLWYLFNNGTLTKERNDAARKYGYGAVFNEQEDICMVLGAEQSFAERSLDAIQCSPFY